MKNSTIIYVVAAGAVLLLIGFVLLYFRNTENLDDPEPEHQEPEPEYQEPEPEYQEPEPEYQEPEPEKISENEKDSD